MRCIHHTIHICIFSVASYLNYRHLHFHPLNKDDIELGFGTKDKKSREERLTELDGMKDQLSEDEYYAKRAEILSDV